jgi:hypothetical protein
MELSDKRKLLRDRIKLIRALQRIDKTSLTGTRGEYSALCQLVDSIREDKNKHFVSFSQEDPHKISYADKPQHKYDNTKRYKTTIGRYIRKQLNISQPDFDESNWRDKETIRDNVLERLSYNLFGELADPNDLPIQIVCGSAITQAYEDEVGIDSCMTGSKSHLVSLYEMNPDKVSMLIYDGDKARALIWTTDSGEKIVDRIYPNDGSHTRAIRKWAKANGYDTREHNGAVDAETEYPLLDKQYYVTLKHRDVFPYMDTFYWGHIKADGTIIVSNMQIHGNDVVLQDTEGYYIGEVECVNCGRLVNDDDAYCDDDGNRYCGACWNNIFTDCEYCGDRVERDETCEVSGYDWCSHCADNHATECECCGNLYHEDDLVFVNELEIYLCSDCHEDRRIEEEQEKREEHGDTVREAIYVGNSANVTIPLNQLRFWRYDDDSTFVSEIPSEPVYVVVDEFGDWKVNE